MSASVLKKTKHFPSSKAGGTAAIKNGIPQSWVQILILLSNYDLGPTVLSLSLDFLICKMGVVMPPS